jgi:hypothetical protein
MTNPAPTLVSTFEILFTPQLPPGLGPSAVQAAVENVVKGYFLTIANINPKAYTFTVGFHCNPTPGSPSNRTLASAVGFLDNGTAGAALTINTGATADDFAASVTVPAEGTVLIGILPAFFNNSGLVPPTIEVRGWVDITLPALSKGRPPFVAFGTVAQASAPVGVLLTPEQRLTFLPRAGDAPTAVEAQAAFALPLAKGVGEVFVPPQPGGFIVFEPRREGA